MLETIVRQGAAHAWALHPGATVDADRTIVERVGGGLDHEVYTVDDRRFGRCVAKLARPRLVASGGACAVLAQEAAALQRLAGPGVVRCLDAVLRGDCPHLLLEYVPGVTLRELLRQGQAPPAAGLAALGAALADTLATIAARGWVHLDVKPENVIVAPRPRLIDFNIALHAADAARLRVAIGTPAYMAPEQRAAGGLEPGLPIGPPADVYALATTLREALIGSDRRLDAVLAAALAHDPALRPSAAELAAGLRAAIGPADRASPGSD